MRTSAEVELARFHYMLELRGALALLQNALFKHGKRYSLSADEILNQAALAIQHEIELLESHL